MRASTLLFLCALVATAAAEVNPSCDPGTGLVGDECVDCQRGTYRNGFEGNTCTPCQAGRYQDLEQATHCTECRPGRFQPGTGATSCIDCSVSGVYGVPRAR